MSEGKPPVYTWTVTTAANGGSRFTVEACVSHIAETGHLVLYGPDREPVFTAEPGQGCTFQRRARVEASAAAAFVSMLTGEEAETVKAVFRGEVSVDDGRRKLGLPPIEAPATEPEGPPADHWTSETVERVTHTATGKSAEAPTRDEATGKLVRRLVEDGDISINAARSMHGLKLFDIPEAGQRPVRARCCGEGIACPNCA